MALRLKRAIHSAQEQVGLGRMTQQEYDWKVRVAELTAKHEPEMRAEGDTVRVTSRRGSVLIGVRVSNRQAPGQVFIPMHYREAAANLLTNPALDPYAKIAEFKISAVRIECVSPLAI